MRMPGAACCADAAAGARSRSANRQGLFMAHIVSHCFRLQGTCTASVSADADVVTGGWLRQRSALIAAPAPRCAAAVDGLLRYPQICMRRWRAGFSPRAADGERRALAGGYRAFSAARGGQPRVGLAAAISVADAEQRRGCC